MRLELRSLALATALAVSACIGISVTGPPPEKRVPVPDKIESETEPVLEPTEYPDILADEDFVVPLYYSPKTEQWYRWAFNRWYVAFSWNGNWFPLPEDEVPELLVKVRPPPTQEEVVDELEALERKLEEIESVEQLPDLPEGEIPTTDRKGSIESQLEELERQMREIEEQEGQDPNRPPASTP